MRAADSRGARHRGLRFAGLGLGVVPGSESPVVLWRCAPGSAKCHAAATTWIVDVWTEPGALARTTRPAMADEDRLGLIVLCQSEHSLMRDEQEAHRVAVPITSLPLSGPKRPAARQSRRIGPRTIWNIGVIMHRRYERRIGLYAQPRPQVPRSAAQRAAEGSANAVAPQQRRGSGRRPVGANGRHGGLFARDLSTSVNCLNCFAPLPPSLARSRRNRSSRRSRTAMRMSGASATSAPSSMPSTQMEIAMRGCCASARSTHSGHWWSNRS